MSPIIGWIHESQYRRRKVTPHTFCGHEASRLGHGAYRFGSWSVPPFVMERIWLERKYQNSPARTLAATCEMRTLAVRTLGISWISPPLLCGFHAFPRTDFSSRRSATCVLHIRKRSIDICVPCILLSYTHFRSTGHSSITPYHNSQPSQLLQVKWSHHLI